MIRFYFLSFSVLFVSSEISFDNPVANIDETAKQGVTIAKLKSCEKNCVIENIKPTNGPFSLSESCDVVYRYGSTKLNYSLTSTYIIHVKCVSGSAKLEVDVHPNSPPFITDWPAYTVTDIKAKDTVKDKVIYKITATDPNNDTLTYTMYSDPDLEYFKIDSTTGEITAAIDLKRATVDVIPLKINVSDGLNSVGPFTVYIRLQDLHSLPVFTNLPNNVTIKEDASAGDTLIQLTFNDPYRFDTNNFEQTCSVFPNSESYKFKYDKSSQKLKLDKVPDGDTLLDYETTKFYNITCVIDDGFLESKSYLNVFVQNVNEEPTFNQDVYICNLYESKAGVSTCDLPMTITEPEDQDFKTTLLPGNNSDRFALDTANNKLTFSTNYDVDNNVMPDQAIISIGAVDSAGKTGTAKIQVNIRDMNDNAPDFGTTGTAYTIGADTALGVLGTVSADDPDEGSNGDVVYSLSGGSVSALAYVNVLGNGEIRYSNQYDYSLAGQTHYLEVTAKDKGSPQKTATTTIAVEFQTTTTTTPAPTVKREQGINNGGSSSSSTSSSSSFLDSSTNVALLATLLSLLGLAGLAALLCCCCRGGCLGSGSGAGKGFCDCECFGSKKVEEVQPRPRRVRRVVREPEPEIIKEQPKQVQVVEELVEEPHGVSTVVPYSQSVVSYSGGQGYSTEMLPYNGYDGYDGYDGYNGNDGYDRGYYGY